MSNGRGYRRGSVFGGLLLIGVGALFLYANLNPEFSAWPLIARFWPVLIIFWGLGKLVDYLILRDTPEGAAAARLTGGDIFSLILLLLFGTLISRTVNTGWWSGRGIVIDGEELGCLLGNEYEFTDELTQTVTAPLTLSVINTRGGVTLTGGADNQIRLVARKKVCASSEADAARLAEAFEPTLEGQGGDYAFRWTVAGAESRAVGAQLEIQVPRATTLNLSTSRGDVRVSDLEGGVTLDLNHSDAVVEKVGGDVRLSLARGAATLESIGGRVEINGRGDEIRVRNVRGGARVEGSYYGPIELAAIGGVAEYNSNRTEFRTDSLPGELQMDSGDLTLRNAPGDVTLHTRNYEIKVEEVGGQLRIENRNGRVTIRAAQPPTQPIEVSNRSGSIEITLPAASGFVISAQARNGDIDSDFSGDGLNLKEERGDASLEGTYGNGRAAIQLSTSHATIYLRRTRAAARGTSGG